VAGGGGFGSTDNKTGSAPGFVDPFSMGILQQNTGNAMQAMHNRFAQLGLGVPDGSPSAAAASGTSLHSTGPGTAEQMDLGQMPSLTGGIPGMAMATLGEMQTNALNQPTVSPRILQQTALDVVELYPYIEYMKYLLPGSLVLAMFVSVMIGGGMLYIDDKARGVHEGYLVTPITKLELVLGLNLAGAIKAVMTGVVIVGVGAMLAGVGTIFHPATLLGLILMIVLTSLALNTMMFLLMVRIEDPLVPRAMFGILNTLLFFPSGSVYPIQAFPAWLRFIARIDPFTYAVDGFKSLLLKETSLVAVWGDMLFLFLFAAVTLSIAIPLFKRTL